MWNWYFLFWISQKHAIQNLYSFVKDDDLNVGIQFISNIWIEYKIMYNVNIWFLISIEIIDNSDKENVVGVRNLLFYEIKRRNHTKN